jgi:sucrose-phosphate synthase
MTKDDGKLYIALISVHGLIRGDDLELGRDADTGGQTKYVVELAQALDLHPDVERVDLITQRVVDADLDPDYSGHIEQIGDKAQIVRVDIGDGHYLPKEELWPRLDTFTDHALNYLQQQERMPDLIHAHYADAGYVGTRLAGLLGLPLVFTGHSLGRVKRRRLLAGGATKAELEAAYFISRRIEAEERTLGAADLVIASTRQEVEAQYGLYDYYQPQQMWVVPPGVDVDRFHPPQGTERDLSIKNQVDRYLTDPDKPWILALSRPDRRKNITGLIEAYGESPELQAVANLVIIAGNRDDIRDLNPGAREVMTEILHTIDKYDLYGKVAYPKHHRTDDVPDLYRLATLSKGVFVNPALTEPFGLTLLEAAASGLPVAATDDGGPIDIISNCHNGELIDPLDPVSIAEAILRILTDPKRWNEYSEAGQQGVKSHYIWQAHTAAYIDKLRESVVSVESRERPVSPDWSGRFRDRAFITDLDHTLLGDRESLRDFSRIVKENRKRMVFGIATSRRLGSALRVLREYEIAAPDVLITSFGTDIYYNPGLTQDTAWRQHIDHMWNAPALKRILNELPGLEMQSQKQQGKFKLSYNYNPALAPDLQEIRSLLLQGEQTVNATVSERQYLDVVPVRASKSAAIRWFTALRDVPLENVLVAGGSGADEEMMSGITLAVVVASRQHEPLTGWIDPSDIYFADKPYAAGVLEAMDYYDFLGECRRPTGVDSGEK